MRVWRAAALSAAGLLACLAVLGSPAGGGGGTLEGPRPVAAAASPYLSPVLGGAEWSRLPTGRPVVALTFDAGANADGVPSILGTLAREQVPATFFLTGRWVEEFPDSARQIAASPSYAIGNHTYDHPYLTQLGDAQVRTELAQAESVIAYATGRDPHPLFRFPYGDRDARTLGIVHSMGYGSIRWTVDTLGWEGISGGQSVASVVSRVIDAAGAGEIVLMHVGSAPDGSTLDADALPEVIARLRAGGYGFVNLMAFLRELRTDAVVRGVDGATWHRWWDGQQWSGWESLGGLTPVNSNPAVASWGYDRLDVFVRGIDDQLWHRAWEGTWWGAWEPLGGILTSAPAVASRGLNSLDVFVRGIDNQLWHKQWTGTAWSGWEPLGGILTSAPAAVARGIFVLDVFVRGIDNQLWQRTWGGSSWSDWQPHGGILTSAATAAATGSSDLHVFVRGTDNQLWHISFHDVPGARYWSAWEPLGGILAGAPGADSRGPDVIDVFVRGRDDQLWHKWGSGTVWGSWGALGGILTSAPSAAA